MLPQKRQGEVPENEGEPHDKGAEPFGRGNLFVPRSRIYWSQSVWRSSTLSFTLGDRQVVITAPQRVICIRRHSSVVEHFLGKKEVAGSIPAVGSKREARLPVGLTFGWDFPRRASFPVGQ